MVTEHTCLCVLVPSPSAESHGEMDRWQNCCANQSKTQDSVVVGRARGGGARPSEPEAVLEWAAAAKQNSEYTRNGLMGGVAVQ